MTCGSQSIQLNPATFGDKRGKSSVQRALNMQRQSRNIPHNGGATWGEGGSTNGPFSHPINVLERGF